MRRSAFPLAPILAVAAALMIAPAEAKGGKGHKGKGWQRHSSVERHGPPAWAPAHGYRRKVVRSYPGNRSYSRSYSTTYRTERWVERW